MKVASREVIACFQCCASSQLLLWPLVLTWWPAAVNTTSCTVGWVCGWWEHLCVIAACTKAEASKQLGVTEAGGRRAGGVPSEGLLSTVCFSIYSICTWMWLGMSLRASMCFCTLDKDRRRNPQRRGLRSPAGEALTRWNSFHLTLLPLHILCPSWRSRRKYLQGGGQGLQHQSGFCAPGGAALETVDPLEFSSDTVDCSIRALPCVDRWSRDKDMVNTREHLVTKNTKRERKWPDYFSNLILLLNCLLIVSLTFCCFTNYWNH